MCDIGSSRKFVVFLLLCCLARYVKCVPQLDLPPYQSNAQNYPSRPSFTPNPDYSINPNPNYRTDSGYPREPSGQRPQDDRFNENEIVKRYGGDVRRLLQELDLQASQQCTNNVAAQWNFETNVNQATQLEALNSQQAYSEFQHELWDLLNHVGNVNGIPDPTTYRQIRYYSVVGPAALSPDQLDRYNRLINDMLAIYNTASICEYKDHFQCGLKLKPDLTKIMAKSRNWDELQHVWSEWRRSTGMKIKETYEQMVHVSDTAAKLNNFTSTADYWSFPFESPALELDLQDAWEDIKPLYELLHAYVRRKLREYYGPERINRQAPLPSHILGNMWAQSWGNIYDITQPYPGEHFLDVTPEMIKQGYTPIDMFRLAEDFFVSMNMSAMSLDFWQGSIFEEPPERVVLCQPSAWDFCNRRDFRIKMCARVNMKDLITAHHEMAHIHYFMGYKNQPKVFRDGANPAFHEAIGEAISLSVGTPTHLQALGLLQTSIEDSAVDINFLYSMALEKVVFLPFAYVMDKWRYDVFSGKIGKEEYNCHWHLLREEYQGIKPPVLRSERDFDPGSKYHIPANIPYLRYFVSTLLQFQIYKALCQAAGQYVPGDLKRPLHKCDIYRSKEAGRILTNIMEKGSSQSWRDVLFQATGDSRLDGGALREYFNPLEEWLRNENLRTGEYIGWLYDGDYCKQSIETAGLQVFGGFYNSGQRNCGNILILVSIALCVLRLR
ncbi:angiotensin-converting enzyme [Cylas formicarius]|uniref:angiotensin-converting enzyme n=1 Tax=Cylas formicarius TaxID=197179 RepID=UPI0029587846|nr:angiotensin-converting enzyme [Cylas formicarius]